MSYAQNQATVSLFVALTPQIMMYQWLKSEDVYNSWYANFWSVMTGLFLMLSLVEVSTDLTYGNIAFYGLMGAMICQLFFLVTTGLASRTHTIKTVKTEDGNRYYGIRNAVTGEYEININNFFWFLLSFLTIVVSFIMCTKYSYEQYDAALNRTARYNRSK